MLQMGETAHVQPLDDGLTLRTAARRSDVERVAEFNGQIHGPGLSGMTSALFLDYPDTCGRDLVFVEDGDGKVVSSLCLLPWDLRYGEARIVAGEMGIVGTAPEYRRRGLIRHQVAFFKQRLRERGCLLSHIQGIGYFYRQFGYQYVWPLEGGLVLEPRQVPAPTGMDFRFRIAAAADVGALQQMYSQAGQDLAFRAARSADVWRYLLDCTAGTEAETETWLAERASGEVAGYVRVPAHHFRDELMVGEASRLGFDAALATLGHLKALAAERGAPGIRLCLPANSALMRLGRSLEARDLGTYAWQVHVPDLAALLAALRPVFEARLASSPFAGLTLDVRISLYRDEITLRFVGGCLVEVMRGKAGDSFELRCPPEAFVPLALGDRSLDELHGMYPDLGVPARWRWLIDTLFPKVGSFLYSVY